jgi:DNA polymerase-3 subunit gamma/tau
MSYLVLARKWRPQTFEDVVNQKHVVLTLQNALKTNRLANAYLFAGPRGIGKTTIARILAKAINCQQGPAVNPCNQCDSCNDITEGRSLDVLEIDGASNRGIDEVRNLRESLKYAPNAGKYKIYIIDEVHMLTTEAFNALLKTLEEPPSRVMFMFATTEPHKVPATIISRCQRFDFKRLSIGEIIEQLKHICAEEKIDIDDESLHLIARKAEGSMRDSQSLLDQAISFCGNQIQVRAILEILGVIDWDIFFELTDDIARQEVKSGFQLVETIFYNGYDIIEFLNGVTEHLRNILIVKATNSVDLIEVSDNYKQRYLSLAAGFEEQDLLRLIQLVADGQANIKRSTNPRVFLEVLITKMIQLHRIQKIETLIQGIDALKETLLQSHVTTNRRSNPDVQGAPSKPISAAPVRPQPAASQSISTATPSIREQEVVPVAPAIAGVSPSPPATLAASTPAAITLSMVTERWEQIIEEIKKQKIALGSFLNEGWPESVADNELVVAFGLENGFHISSINRNRKEIEAIIQQVLGVPLRIKCIQSSVTAEPRSNGANGNSYVEKLGQKIPLIKTIIEEFDGELVK